MRGITATMVQAFYDGKPKKMKNTEVAIEEEDGRTWVKMYLHGSAIAKRRIGGTALLLSAAGWSTVTTKERLNGIAGRYGIGIWQVNFEWYWGHFASNSDGWDRRTIDSFDTNRGSWTVVYAESPGEELYEEVVNGGYYYK